ncbi:MAG: nitroreductase [Candidatus Altiarchaeota archaeon]|nr:nitroreductase [Candidatus Altiarchaeota archaeon]
METLKAVKERRSIRAFTGKTVEEDKIREILEAGRWAPSGLNNQPWRFRVVPDEKTRRELAKETRYGNVIRSAPACIAIFLDNNSSYDRTKDLQAVGACIQNMLLAVHDLGLGGCWLGEILKNREDVANILGTPENCELMAVIALGYASRDAETSARKELSELTF